MIPVGAGDDDIEVDDPDFDDLVDARERDLKREENGERMKPHSGFMLHQGERALGHATAVDDHDSAVRADRPSRGVAR